MAENTRFSVATTPAFTPFWRRLPRFFVYPMQAGSLMRIAGYSIFGTIAMLIPPLFGALLRIILWVVFLKYAFVVMERTANGQFDEPSGVNGNEEGETAQVVRQYVFFIILGLCAGLFVLLFGKAGYLAGSWLPSLLLPAGIMIIAVTHSLGQAVNPKQIWFYMKTIGSPYLALCFFLLSFFASSRWLQGFLYSHLHPALALPLLSFTEFYFTLITYHMMGYVIYQYHEPLGVDADVSFEEATAKLSPAKAADPVLSRLAALVADGHNEEAISLLQEELRKRWESNDLHDRYQKLLVLSGKQIEATRHAREFIAKLISEKRMFQALDLCEQYLKADPEFQLQDSFQVHELASAARIAKRHRLALDLMRRFDKRYPGHPHIPQVYLLSAQILSEHCKMDKEAAQILRALRAKFPDHAAAAEAGQYLAVLDRLAIG